MTVRSWAGAAAAVTALVFGFRCPAAPLEAYGQLPTLEMAALSPDGAQVALIVTSGETRTLTLAHTSDLRPYFQAVAGTKKIRSIQWAGPEHLILTISHTAKLNDLEGPKREWFTAIDLNFKVRKFRILLSGQPDTLDAVNGEPMIRIVGGHPYAFLLAEHFIKTKGYLSLFKVDLDRDTSQLLMLGNGFTEDWLVDEQGQPMACAQYFPDSGVWTLIMNRKAGWEAAKSLRSEFGGIHLEGLGRDGRSAVLAMGGDDTIPVRELGIDAKEWSAPLFESFDPHSIHDPLTGRLIGAYALEGDKDRYVFFEPRDQARWDAAVKPFAGDRVTLVSASADLNQMVVEVDSPVHGPAFSFVDVEKHSAEWIGPVYQAVGEDIAPKRALAFKASDGLALTGYLTLPKGNAPGKLPLVVFPHGGPAARDEPGFDWWAQAMASRGYAVLQVNYRGSDGFGWKFLSAGFGQYGRKMQTDLSDGVRYLVSQGLVDPKRVCIVGASYGGYAALAGVTLDTGVYRCAVSVAGVADMARMVTWDKNRSTVASERYWKHFVGVDQGGSFDDISPIRHVAKVDVPILLIHGADDTVVPIEQSRMMSEALVRAGKHVELLTLKSEDHWLTSGETRLEMLQATVGFLERNNPPQ
jgi:dipeptidyl aminopeptidase/acylaminoacyl peptidase